MEPTDTYNPGNFANRPHEEVVDAAKKGGHASHGGVEEVAAGNGNSGNVDAAKKGGMEEVAAGNGNPGNFANRPHDEVVDAAKKGGKASAII
ncbi:hypothetical protein BP5796_07843 [Coleophoma crateriformis]|uniref:Conidiation-specific protein 10 n=1 Tax=Coleophoma crateriformis TaxID=565419 RepID=A0A3D8RCN2_9HELO|nr:hypothetical protein BP5796_07843 [Coleophoma crateriformis]